MMSSGASWEPSSDTHGSPTDSANWRTSADLPIPGGPQMNTGSTGATFSRNGTSVFGVRGCAACIGLMNWVRSRRDLWTLRLTAPFGMNWVKGGDGQGGCNLSAVWGACYGGAMAVTLDDLDRRATALEHAQGDTTATLRWAAGTLGRMQAVQDDHTQRLQRIATTLVDHTQTLVDHSQMLADHTQRLERVEATPAEHTQRLDRLEAKVAALPRAVAEQLDATERRLLAAIAGR